MLHINSIMLASIKDQDEPKAEPWSAPPPSDRHTLLGIINVLERDKAALTIALKDADTHLENASQYPIPNWSALCRCRVEIAKALDEYGSKPIDGALYLDIVKALRKANEKIKARDEANGELIGENIKLKESVAALEKQIAGCAKTIIGLMGSLDVEERECERLRDLLDGDAPSFNFLEFLNTQRKWSLDTFPGQRAAGVLAHIKKELAEIERDPNDLVEWIDVILLAFSGAWRTGAGPMDVVEMLDFKLRWNQSRKWSKPADPDMSVEHDRGEGEAA